MNFWDRISKLLEDLPEEDRKFTENAWSAFSKLAVQLWADTVNAMASISPEDIPIYDIRYWQKVEKDSTWDVPTGVYRIPKLQDLIFAEIITEYVEGTDYNLTGGALVWVSYDTGTSTSVGDGFLTDTGKNWAINEYQDYTLEDSASTLFAIVSNTDDTLIVVGTPATGAYKINREPVDGSGWAEQVFYYNGYLDTKLGYDLRFNGINTAGYTPIHAHHLARALNYAYRSSDTEFALKVGITAILGLPFAYTAGTIKSKSTAGGNHTVVITDGSGVDHDIVIDSGLCDLADLPDVGATVLEYEPLIALAIKVGKNTSQAYLPKVDSTYPTDGDMELVGTANWTAISSGVVTKNTSEQYEGARCLKTVAAVVGRGVKPAANQTVVAGNEYLYEFYAKSLTSSGAVVGANVWDVTNNKIITSEWFGDESYEHGYIRFVAPELDPSDCISVNIEFIAINTGTFFVDNLDLFEVKELTNYAADKTANSVKASYTIPAASRAGSADLIFSASDHIYGVNGNYVEWEIEYSSNNQALSSEISGSGTSGDHYIYKIITGTEADQSSNDAIVAFVNSDPNALRIIAASTSAPNSDPDAFDSGPTALAGGLDATISTYEAVFYEIGDTIDVRNFTNGTKETKKITGVASGSAPYSKILSLDGDLFAVYVSPETGTSTDTGSGYLEDTGKTWATNEHQGDVLIDSADDSFTINTSDTDTVYVTGTPASGAYRITKDHVGVCFGERATDYADVVKIYNRWITTFDQDNVDAYVANIGDLGHTLVFEDLS
jgi:hypothetical protein